jgi:hypothetical protein
MTKQAAEQDAYRTQLRRWARALARGEVVHDGLAPGTSAEQVWLFVEGNLDKRHDMLAKLLTFLAGAFDGFDDLLDKYIATVPLAAQFTGSGDADGFLAWLERRGGLAPEQHDLVACQRARFAILETARRDRRVHVRFQKRLARTERCMGRLESGAPVRLHLNPIRVWTRFTTRTLVDEETTLPADLVFFAVRDGIRTAVVEPAGWALLGELAASGPCTPDQWRARSAPARRTDLAAWARDLAEMGLLALGR